MVGMLKQWKNEFKNQYVILLVFCLTIQMESKAFLVFFQVKNPLPGLL
jgi:hypothetical protein